MDISVSTTLTFFNSKYKSTGTNAIETHYAYTRQIWPFSNCSDNKTKVNGMVY